MRKFIVAVDFDGTVVDFCYPDVGVSVPDAADWIKKWQDAGADIVLNTMRSGKELMDAAEWFSEKDIKLTGINEHPEQKKWTESKKCWADIYVDDAAFGCPLIIVKGFKRKCVDFDIVGPKILKRIKFYE